MTSARPPACLVEVGVSDHHGDAGGRRAQQHAAHRRLVAHRRKRREHQRMMREHSLAALAPRGRQRRLVDLERHQQAAHLGVARAHLQAHVVPRLGQRKGRQAVDLGQKLTYDHAAIVPPGPRAAGRCEAGGQALWRRRRKPSTLAPTPRPPAAASAEREEATDSIGTTRKWLAVAALSRGHGHGPARHHHHEHRRALHRLGPQHLHPPGLLGAQRLQPGAGGALPAHGTHRRPPGQEAGVHGRPAGVRRLLVRVRACDLGARHDRLPRRPVAGGGGHRAGVAGAAAADLPAYAARPGRAACSAP